MPVIPLIRHEWRFTECERHSSWLLAVSASCVFGCLGVATFCRRFSNFRNTQVELPYRYFNHIYPLLFLITLIDIEIKTSSKFSSNDSLPLFLLRLSSFESPAKLPRTTSFPSDPSILESPRSESSIVFRIALKSPTVDLFAFYPTDEFLGDNIAALGTVFGDEPRPVALSSSRFRIIDWCSPTRGFHPRADLSDRLTNEDN